MTRRFTASVFPVFNGKVLLIKHKKLDMWLPPGGKLEPNETPFEAAERELFEETGLSGTFPEMRNEPHGTPLGYLGFEEHAVEINGRPELHMNFCFMCNVTTDVIVSDDSYTEHRWVTVEEAKMFVDSRNVMDLLLKIESLM